MGQWFISQIPAIALFILLWGSFGHTLYAHRSEGEIPELGIGIAIYLKWKIGSPTQ